MEKNQKMKKNVILMDMISSTSKVLLIDRSVPTNYKAMHADMLHYYSIYYEDPLSMEINSIDISQVFSKLILDNSEVRSINVNQHIQRNLAALKNEGYIYLDLKILESLLLKPEFFPREWIEIADTESYNSKSGSIRFDGTILKSKDSGELKILTADFNRGHWEVGFAPLEINQKELDAFLQTGSVVQFRLYSAVVKPR